MDMFTPEERSALMARIRSTGTAPEARLCALVRSTLGGAWPVEQNVRSLPGNPDVVVPSLALVIFADGCFFHGCPVHSRVPRSNADYWGPKIARNARRDISHRRRLRRLGFAVWRFWEHDLKGRQVEKTSNLLRRRLERRIAQVQASQLRSEILSAAIAEQAGPIPHGG
jgi:DNA mismatch endonuclease (patch repair protein)